MKPIVAIVGRPNVGKSSLFNRIVRQRLAIVEGEPGVTRDRLYAAATWLEHEFIVVDTGGIEIDPTLEMSAETRLQAEEAVREADVILFVVDARAGVTTGDEDVAQLLRKSRRAIIVVANKVDDGGVMPYVADFYALGLGEPIAVSAEHGRNIGDLLDAVVASIPVPAPDQNSTDEIAVAVIGRPNVGKSSLVNTLVGKQRMIVSNVPGTTRDAVDSVLQHEHTTYRLVDTAGIRRQARVDSNVEHYSVLRAMRAVERSDVCVVLIDANEGVTEQDQRIAGMPHEAGKAVVIAVNKWDMITKDTSTMQKFEQRVRNDLAFIPYAPILFISAMTGQRAHRVLTTARHVYEQASLRISTGRLNEVLQEAMQRHQPPSDKGRRLRILFATQVDTTPPHFVLFMNEPDLFHFSYRRYIESRFRDAFGFEGTPIVITAKRRGE